MIACVCECGSLVSLVHVCGILTKDMSSGSRGMLRRRCHVCGLRLDWGVGEEERVRAEANRKCWNGEL